MHRALVLALSLTTLAGCPQDPVTVGFRMQDFFPVDNDRKWVFSNMDQELDYVIDGTMRASDRVTMESGQSYAVLHYERRCIEDVEECGAGFLYDLYMWSDGSGVEIWGYETPEKGQVVFETPIVLADGRMGRGQSVTSLEVDGHVFTTTFSDLEKDGSLDRDGNPIPEELGCDQQVGVEWECVRMTLESDPPGHWLAGEWWASSGWNVVAWNRTGDEGKWRTISASGELPPDEGDGDTDDTDQ